MTKNILVLLAALGIFSIQLPQLLKSDERTYHLTDNAELPSLDELISSTREDQDSFEPSLSDTRITYPRQVCRNPGFPRKPHWDRPGDINRASAPAQRYCQNDCMRSGWPHGIRNWSACSVDPHYSASYVGGGAPGIFKGRDRTCEEGTWGLDYSLWSKPGQVWMKWSNRREQGGLGAYATDHEPLLLRHRE